MQGLGLVRARQRDDARLVAILGVDHDLSGHLDELARIDAGRAHAVNRRKAEAGDAAFPVRPFLRIVEPWVLWPALRLLPRCFCVRQPSVGGQHDRACAPFTANDGQAIGHLHQFRHFRIEA